jgi:hypothetical protein
MKAFQNRPLLWCYYFVYVRSNFRSRQKCTCLTLFYAHAFANTCILLHRDDARAYLPFNNLDVLLTHHAHLATFTHYLLANGFVEDELVFVSMRTSVCVCVCVSVCVCE